MYVPKGGWRLSGFHHTQPLDYICTNKHYRLLDDITTLATDWSVMMSCYLPIIGSILSELDQDEFAKSTAVVISNRPRIAKRLKCIVNDVQCLLSSLVTNDVWPSYVAMFTRFWHNYQSRIEVSVCLSV